MDLVASLFVRGVVLVICLNCFLLVGSGFAGGGAVEEVWITDDCIFEIVGGPDEPVIKRGDPGTEDINGGFEGGRVLKHKGEYHGFPTERAGIPGGLRKFDRINTRIAHWKSADGFKWERVGTLYKSSGTCTDIEEDNPFSDRRASLWAAMPVYDEGEGRWNLFYVAYTVNLEIPPNHSFGRIWRAVSAVAGPDGLGGPYEDVGIVIEPGLESQHWEGRQGVDSFFPYKVGDKWYGFYGGAFAIANDRVWRVGLAEAPALAGPWKRMGAEVNPIRTIHPWFVENPVVSRLGDGTYIAFFDGGPTLFKLPNMMGYTLSLDGLRWSKAVYIPLHKEQKQWWHTMRTTLGFIPEGDNTYTVFFTAWADIRFHQMGMAKLRLKPEKLAEAVGKLRKRR